MYLEKSLLDLPDRSNIQQLTNSYKLVSMHLILLFYL